MSNIYNSIQNLYNMDKKTWQEILSEMYNIVYENNDKQDLINTKFEIFENKFGNKLSEQVINKFREMLQDGSLKTLLNEVINTDIFEELNSQLDKKAPKDLATPTKEGLMAKEDKIKLNGIDENANNYEHPLTHSASIIEQDTTHRFVTDDNIAKWNGVKSLGVSGYYKLAGGMIIQWGTCTSGGDALEIIGSTNWYHSRADATFPIQFPNACNILIATAVGSKYISCAEGGKTNKGAIILLSTPLNSGSSHKVVNWIAIGY